MPVTLLKRMSTAFTFVLLVFFPASEGCSFKGSPPHPQGPRRVVAAAAPSPLRVLSLLHFVSRSHGLSRVPWDCGSAFNKKGKGEGIFHSTPPEYLQSLPG